VEVNKEVFDLARKLDYLGVDFYLRREIIEKCIDPENKANYRIYSLRKQIDKSYEEVKIALENFEKEYNSSIIERDFIQLN
jgi:hypothetical protein